MTTPMNDAVALDALDLSPPLSSVSAAALKHAYRKAARAYHPDAPGGDADQFRLVTEAASYLERRLSGEIPDPVRFDPDISSTSRRRSGPVWTPAHSRAADAIDFDDILEGLRTATRQIRPLIECLANGEVLVTRIPPGGAVSFDMARGATVYDTDGEIVDCDRQIVGNEDRFRGSLDDVLDGIRGRRGE